MKLVTPAHARELEIERVGLTIAAGRLPVATPEIVAEGELEGWPYLVMTLLGGEPAEGLWGRLDGGTRARLIAEMGALAAAIHALPLADAGALRMDWRAYLEARRAAMVDKHRARGLDERWIAEVVEFVDALPPVAEWPADEVFLHNDIHLDHVHLAIDGGTPRLCGFLDFADAQIGAREAEFVTVGGFLAVTDPHAASIFLRGYGMSPEALTPELARRLTGHVLVNRYCDIAPILRRYPEEARPRSLAELHRRMWDFG